MNSSVRQKNERIDMGDYSDIGAQYTQISHVLCVNNGATRDKAM